MCTSAASTNDCSRKVNRRDLSGVLRMRKLKDSAAKVVT